MLVAAGGGFEGSGQVQRAKERQRCRGDRDASDERMGAVSHSAQHEGTERWILIGIVVNSTAFLTQTMGRVMRFCQTGYVQTYGLVFFAGVVLLVAYGLGGLR